MEKEVLVRMNILRIQEVYLRRIRINVPQKYTIYRDTFEIVQIHLLYYQEIHSPSYFFFQIWQHVIRFMYVFIAGEYIYVNNSSCTYLSLENIFI